MKNTVPFRVLALPVFFLTTAAAQQQTLKVEPQSSVVAFSLGDVLHQVHGTFHVQSGTVEFDPRASKIGGSVVVAAGSGKSGNDARDRKMNTEILDAAHFAEVSFAPRSYQGAISPAGDSRIQVTGVFTLHGAQHDLTVPMEIHIEGTNCTVKTHFAVPYVKWGLKDPSAFILRVSKEVEIDLSLVGALTRPS